MTRTPLPATIKPAYAGRCKDEGICRCPCRCDDNRVIPRRSYMGYWYCLRCGHLRGTVMR